MVDMSEIQDKSLSNKGNLTLSRAKKAKQDEFYTQLIDIENELRHYTAHFRNKIVLCNCDDPYESNFFKYFVQQFNILGLKKLIAISYKGSPMGRGGWPLIEIAGLRVNRNEPYVFEINYVPAHNHKGMTDLTHVEYLLEHDANAAYPLIGDEYYDGGDFRSGAGLEYLEQADIIVTNPPFSLFREFVAQLIEYKKDFLIIGNVNAITYKEIFSLVKDSKIWLGISITSGDREFRVPEYYPLNAAGVRIDDKGNKYIRVKGVRWYTNLDHKNRHEEITLLRKYTPSEYSKYDNFDAIEVSKVSDIPVDYGGAMGVPITFLDKFNPDQFDIIGMDRPLVFGITGKVSRFFINNNEVYARIVIKKR
ncbi:MAG: adenine-specific methyltransferase EcoRI family protein [Candidatus Symbiobacter sp.]|nr:adenine-specific methyltransferase EcoRI family protein [Candidatus Symbiobacter sp.]